MVKSLSERIAARSLKKKSSRGAQNRAVFLALRTEIKQALNDGWSIKSVWDTLCDENKIHCSYQAFRSYTNNLILLPDRQSTDSTPGEQQVEHEKKAASEETKKKAAISKGFTFNPVANKEELF